MKRVSVLVVMVLCATSLFAADVKSGIRAMEDNFEAGVRAGNAEQMAAMYATDGVLMPPNVPTQRGHDAIQKYWAGLLATGKADLKLTIDDVSVSGDVAVEQGTWALTLMPTGATTAVKDNGKYVIVWRMKAGKWWAVSDIYNSDNAPAM